MAPRLTRRHRFLYLAVGGALAFAGGTAAVLWSVTGDDETYRPGQAVEGLTAGLARDLPEDAPRVPFRDATSEAGITFRHFQARRSTRLPEDMGSGAAWGDYDGDGWVDLYVVNQAGPLTLSPSELASSAAHAHLYHNRGDGTFEEVSQAAGVDFRGHGMGAAWGDGDGDGHPDLVVTAYGGITYYRNRGDGSFEDASARAGMSEHEGFWTGASWADYDRDGDLDLYVTGYVRYRELDDGATSLQYETEQPVSLNPSSFEAEANLLFRNRGDGTFDEVAAAAGVAGEGGRSLSAAWTDLDEDGWPDLYVANDVSDNVLHRNRGDGTFEEISHEALVADYRGAMGIAVGDWDGDADSDLFVTHWIAQENALYGNLRRDVSGAEPDPDFPLQFMDEADRYGLGQIALDYIGWGTSFFDYDNDGRLDLFVANGSTFQQDDDPSLLEPMADQLFWNGGADRGFYEVSAVAGPYFRDARVGRGAAFADYDRDGDVDVFVVSHGGPGALLSNGAAETPARWLQVAVAGPPGNPEGLGARVRVVAGGRAQVREVGAQPSYLSQSEAVQHFGLGDAPTADTVEVRWPGGEHRILTGLPANRRIRVGVEGPPEVVGPAGDAGPWGPATAAAGPPADERERIRRFWAVFREATDARVGGRMEEAARLYADALVLNPDHEESLYYGGNALFELGRYGEARAALERLVEVNPRSARGQGRLGALHLCAATGEHRDLEAARRAFEAAAAINREETGAYLRLAEVALLSGRPGEARRHLDLVLGSNPGSVPARVLRGYVAWVSGDGDRAASELRRAVEVATAGDSGPEASAEGDTREGSAALVARESCPSLGDAAERLVARAPGAEGPGARLESRDRVYERLHADVVRLSPGG